MPLMVCQLIERLLEMPSNAIVVVQGDYAPEIGDHCIMEVETVFLTEDGEVMISYVEGE